MLTDQDLLTIRILIKDSIQEHVMVESNWKKHHTDWHKSLQAELDRLNRIVTKEMPATSKIVDEQILTEDDFDGLRVAKACLPRRKGGECSQGQHAQDPCRRFRNGGHMR